jgi:hypothetical protein
MNLNYYHCSGIWISYPQLVHRQQWTTSGVAAQGVQIQSLISRDWSMWQTQWHSIPRPQPRNCPFVYCSSIDRKLIHARTFQCHALLFIAVSDNVVRVRVHVKISNRHRLHYTLFFFNPTENKIIQFFFCAINLLCKQQHVESENMKYLASDAWSDSDNTHRQLVHYPSAHHPCMQSELHTFFYLVYIQCCRRKDIVNKSDKLEKERPFETLFIIICISGFSYICYNRKKRCKSFTERPTHTEVACLHEAKAQTAYVYAIRRVLDLGSTSNKMMYVTHLLTNDTPFWMLSDSSFFAFSSPALQ